MMRFYAKVKDQEEFFPFFFVFFQKKKNTIVNDDGHVRASHTIHSVTRRLVVNLFFFSTVVSVRVSRVESQKKNRRRSWTVGSERSAAIWRDVVSHSILTLRSSNPHSAFPFVVTVVLGEWFSCDCRRNLKEKKKKKMAGDKRRFIFGRSLSEKLKCSSTGETVERIWMRLRQVKLQGIPRRMLNSLFLFFYFYFYGAELNFSYFP